MDKHIAGLFFAGWLGVIITLTFPEFSVTEHPVIFLLLVSPPVIAFRIVLDKIWEICGLLKEIKILNTRR